jgi:hypothetical protein
MNFARGLVSMGTGKPAAAAAEQREAENHGATAAAPSMCLSRQRRFSGVEGFCDMPGPY